MGFDSINYRQPGRYDVDLASLESATDLTGVESMTQQHMTPATEIDNIMKRFYATGEMPRARNIAEYGDFDEANDLATMLEQVEVGKQAFASIPASIRGRFENDPGEFLTWIHDEGNYDEAAELGLVPKREVTPAPEPARAPVTDSVSGGAVVAAAGLQ